MEGLTLFAEVADVREYRSRKRFDIIVVDRTLHMLEKDERSSVMNNLLKLSKKGAYMLIADERSNLPTLNACLSMFTWNWTTVLERQGFLFGRRD